MDREYAVYSKAARVAAKWELPHDRLENGIIIHHIPQSTSQAVSIMNDIRYQAKKYGLAVRFTWLDQWTLKASWYKA